MQFIEYAFKYKYRRWNLKFNFVSVWKRTKCNMMKKKNVLLLVDNAVQSVYKAIQSVQKTVQQICPIRPNETVFKLKQSTIFCAICVTFDVIVLLASKIFFSSIRRTEGFLYSDSFLL